jgi:hypothetical protein
MGWHIIQLDGNFNIPTPTESDSIPIMGGIFPWRLLLLSTMSFESAPLLAQVDCCILILYCTICHTRLQSLGWKLRIILYMCVLQPPLPRDLHTILFTTHCISTVLYSFRALFQCVGVSLKEELSFSQKVDHQKSVLTRLISFISAVFWQRKQHCHIISMTVDCGPDIEQGPMMWHPHGNRVMKGLCCPLSLTYSFSCCFWHLVAELKPGGMCFFYPTFHTALTARTPGSTTPIAKCPVRAAMTCTVNLCTIWGIHCFGYCVLSSKMINS